jgi:hypothetical protein
LTLSPASPASPATSRCGMPGMRQQLVNGEAWPDPQPLGRRSPVRPGRNANHLPVPARTRKDRGMQHAGICLWSMANGQWLMANGQWPWPMGRRSRVCARFAAGCATKSSLPQFAIESPCTKVGGRVGDRVRWIWRIRGPENGLTCGGCAGLRSDRVGDSMRART